MEYVTFIKELTKNVQIVLTIYIDFECHIGCFIFSKSSLSYFQVEFSHSEKEF